jgi:hypothetical protein
MVKLGAAVANLFVGSRGLFLGSRGFASLDDIKPVVAKTPEYDAKRENIEDARALLIFATSKQQTWLVATSVKLYCVLDDLRDKAPVVWWHLLYEIGPEGSVSLFTDEREVVYIHAAERSPESGVIIFGPYKEWLYSLKLFTSMPIEESICRLLIEARGAPPVGEQAVA